MLYQPGALSLRRCCIGEWVKSALEVLVIIFLMNLFFPRYYVDGQSMDPGLHTADRLFASSIDVLMHQIPRGAVVVLSSPRDGASVVKRVVGLPGERVEVRDGVVTVNGVALHEPYIKEAPRYAGMWQLGSDEYFVLGDNRNHSLDSADYGPVSFSHIHGVVKFRFWPLNQLSTFPLPEYSVKTP